MRKLELHVNDMGFLIDEMSTAADKYKGLARAYGYAQIDPERRAQDAEMVKEFKKRERKARRIVRKMIEQGVHYR